MWCIIQTTLCLLYLMLPAPHDSSGVNANGMAVLFTDEPVDCEPNSVPFQSIAKEVLCDHKALAEWGLLDADLLLQLKECCNNNAAGVCAFLGYLMLLHQEMWHKFGNTDGSVSHCFTAFQVALNTSALHQQILHAQSLSPSLQPYVLDILAKVFHHKFVGHLRCLRSAARKRDLPGTSSQPINDIEKEVMYFQGGWIVSDIKFAILRRTKYVDTPLVIACNALCMAKNDAILSMPNETALTRRRDRGSLTYVKPGILKLLIAFEETIRTEVDPQSLNSKSFIKACEKICANDSVPRDLLFDTIWQHRALTDEVQVDLSIVQVLFDKIWAKYYHSRQKSLINQIKHVLKVDAAPAMREDVRHTGKKQRADGGITNKKLKQILGNPEVQGSDIHAMFALEIKSHPENTFMGMTISALHAACRGYNNDRSSGRKEGLCNRLRELVTANACQLDLSYLRTDLAL